LSIYDPKINCEKVTNTFTKCASSYKLLEKVVKSNLFSDTLVTFNCEKAMANTHNNHQLSREELAEQLSARCEVQLETITVEKLRILEQEADDKTLIQIVTEMEESSHKDCDCSRKINFLVIEIKNFFKTNI
jgi:hypothetical protein